MAFSLALPSVSSLTRALYPLKICKSGEPTKFLPCDIVELQNVNQYETPSLPLDDNSFISDNIYKLPKIITARVYVHSWDYEKFLKNVDLWQYDGGFDIYGVDNQKYPNYRITDISGVQSAEVVGAYFFNISFKETILVGAFEAAVVKSASKGAYSGNVNKGETSAKPAEKRSILKDIKRAAGG